MGNKDFKIRISVRNPKNRSLINLTSKSLGITSDKLKAEIEEMINELKLCKQQLPELDKHRLEVSTHDLFPMASVIMLDATPENGMIQIETKLFDSSRNDSFGFQLTKESPFFSKNYTSWQKVLNSSKKIK